MKANLYLSESWKSARAILIEMEGPVVLTSPFYLYRAFNRAQDYFNLPRIDKDVASTLYYGWQARDWYLRERLLCPKSGMAEWWDYVRQFEIQSNWLDFRHVSFDLADIWSLLQPRKPTAIVSFCHEQVARRQMTLLKQQGVLYSANYRTERFRELCIQAARRFAVKNKHLLVIASSYDLAHAAFRLKMPVVFYSPMPNDCGAITFSGATMQSWRQLRSVLQL